METGLVHVYLVLQWLSFINQDIHVYVLTKTNYFSPNYILNSLRTSVEYLIEPYQLINSENIKYSYGPYKDFPDPQWTTAT